MHSAQHLWVETRKPDGQFEQRNVDDCSLRVFVFDGRGNELKPQVRQGTGRGGLRSAEGELAVVGSSRFSWLSFGC